MNKYYDRTIKVYEGTKSKVEVEGKTVTFHYTFRTPDGKTTVVNGIIPLDVAAELTMLLSDALAVPGESVHPTGLVRHDDDIDIKPVVGNFDDTTISS